MKKSLMLGAGLALLLTGAVQAQQPAARRGADVNGDSRISLTEMQAKAEERFTRMDANRDGQLTREERQAARQQMRSDRQQGKGQRLDQMFARRDADGDGFLGQAELGRRWGERFEEVDADRDGRLSRAELQADRAYGEGRRARAPGQARGQGRPRLDADDNGLVTLAEMQARVSVRFARLDVNRDGFVTRDERRAARAARQAG